MESLPKLIVILGPTATGKTSLSIALAKKFEGEIVSADSRKIYTGLDIGSAKPNEEKQQGIPHYGFDLVTPDQHYSVKEFQQFAFSTIDEITKRNHVPFLVGGTGLYISSVVDNYLFENESPDLQLRESLNALSLDELTKRLKKEDPKALSEDDWKNKRRVVRALEFIETTGKKFSQQKRKGEPRYDVLQIGLSFDQETLEQKITKRVHEMMEEGLEEEVRGLANKYGFDAPGMQSISYAEFRPYFEGTQTREQVIEQIVISTRQYAKRQMTWFKRDARIHWIKDGQEAEKLLKLFMNS